MFRTHYELRAGLQQYLYSGYESQSRTGVPLARPLVVDSPEDAQTWRIDDQYFLGDALMVAPAIPTDMRLHSSCTCCSESVCPSSCEMMTATLEMPACECTEVTDGSTAWLPAASF